MDFHGNKQTFFVMTVFDFSGNNHPCSAGTSQIKTRKTTLLIMIIIAIQTMPSSPARAG
jgi:hypothetical protein